MRLRIRRLELLGFALFSVWPTDHLAAADWMGPAGRACVPAALGGLPIGEDIQVGISAVDWIVIVAYALGMLAVGWYCSRRATTTEDYLLGGRAMKPWAVGLSLFATLLSTLSYLAVPGGTQLISRRPTRYAYGVSPVFVSRAKGARFWDVDGHQYIDWVSGIGAIILGYADPVVDDAVRRQIGYGTIYSINHELELELAQELIDTIPCAEMVRYAKCGGEACAIAVRIARGTTGRDKILFCGYHGWHDWYLAANLSSEATLSRHLFPGIQPTGVPRCLEGTAVPFPFGDIDALGTALDRHRGQVAAVIMEPMRTEEPPDGYLREVADLARRHDVLLIFDEVSTGFRITAGGVQPHLGVVPDMAVFAKSISNGYPMGAVVGKRDVMAPAANMFISSTYWSDTIGLRAALTTLREIKSRDVPATLHKTGAELRSRLNRVADEVGLDVRCGGLTIHPHLEFKLDDAQLEPKVATLFIQEMAKRGCHGYTSFYLNAAQGPGELDQTEQAARETFTLIAEGLESGRIDELLQCDPQQDSFRRMVK